MTPVKCISVLLAIVAACLAVPNARNAVVIGNFMYFTDVTEARPRDQALEYCASEGGELAKVWNRQLYNRLRLAVRRTGSYWIDGIDSPNPYRFEMNFTCSNNGEYWGLYGMSSDQLDLPSISCLSLVKGSTEKKSKLQAANCNEDRFVLCQYPLDGCSASTEGYEDYTQMG